MKEVKEIPQAVEIEERILGTFMTYPESIEDFISLLNEDVFYNQKNRIVFKAIFSLYKEGKSPDMLTVTKYISSQPQGCIEVTAYDITCMTNSVLSNFHLKQDIELILDKFLQRNFIIKCNESVEKVYHNKENIHDVIESTRNLIDGMVDSVSTEDEKKLDTLIQQRIKEYEQRAQNPITGIASGLSELDKMTGGFQKTDLIILAARPSMGKSALMLKLAKEAAFQNKACAIFSLEMSQTQLIDRLISDTSEIDLSTVNRGEFKPSEYQQLHNNISKIYELPIYIDDSGNLNTLNFKSKARRMKRKFGVEIIFLDYLQLISGEKGGTRDQEIGSITKTLKQTAKELKIPIVAISSLGRAVEQRGGDKKPMLSDLREGGQIEFDADMVMFLYRPEYYGFMQDENGKSTSGLAQITIAKHRNGTLGTANCQFIGRYSRFCDIIPDFETNNQVIVPENPKIKFQSKMWDDDEKTEDDFTTF